MSASYGGPVTSTQLDQVRTERDIPTRRISFESALAELPRHYTADGDLISSHLVAILSSVFPDGEDFFVRSVRHYRDQISDPKLKEQVKGFIGQESMHGREHRQFNRRLAELGYPTRRIERFTRWGLAQRSRIAPPVSNLAATAALEHFTAILAERILTDEDLRRMVGHEAVRDLFLWHALEESEHKAVAFDVYRAVGGTERMRIITMKITRYGFVMGMTLQTVASLLGDRSTYQPGRLRRSWQRLRAAGFIDRQLWADLKAYERRGFHPDDRDTSGLVEHWRVELFGESGSLSDLLGRATA